MSAKFKLWHQPPGPPQEGGTSLIISMFGPTSDRVQQGGNTGGFVYNNPNGSRFVQNADGSKFYDPGPNGVGRKWYESPDGVRTYIADTHTDNSPSRHVKMEEKEVKMFSSYGQHSSSLRKSKSTPSKSPNKVKDQYDSDDTVPLYPERGTSIYLYLLTTHRRLEAREDKGNCKENRYHNKAPRPDDLEGQCVESKQIRHCSVKASRNPNQASTDTKENNSQNSQNTFRIVNEKPC